MTDRPRVSVVIASKGRPDALILCLNALRFQSYRPFEVVVVACAAGLAAVEGSDFQDRVKLIPQTEGGLSVARNTGIAEAAGEIIAFIDDDAIADPPWLSRVVDALEATGAAGTGGWVRASNGISFEWTGDAVSNELVWGSGTPTVMGTNMAFRAEVLRQVGGFDPAFEYYLDETDLTARLAASGHLVVPIPRAQVHHMGAPNAVRQARRVPTSLARIGESEAKYLRRHAEASRVEPALDRLRAERKTKLLQGMVSGDLGPEEVSALMRGYDRGVVEGQQRDLPPLAPLSRPATKFLPFLETAPQTPVFLSGRFWQKRSKRAKARDLARQGIPVSLFLFSPTFLFHSRRFSQDNIWLQTGGLFGRSDRRQPLAQIHGFQNRVNLEITRVTDSFTL